jgi:carboxyl-terminal processing protease
MARMNLFSPGSGRRWVLPALVLVVLLAAGAFQAGVSYGEKHPQTLLVRGVDNLEATSTPADFSTFWQAWNLIDEKYLRQGEVNGQEKVYGAIQGLVGSLRDPHSVYFPPTDNQKFQEDIQGNFGGIGAELGSRKGGVVVIAPLKNTPAERAGLKAGDLILQVNTSSTEGLSVDEVVNWIRGPKGTEVKLVVLREGLDAPKEIKIVRDTISVPTLDYKIENGIAYIQLYSFNANAETVFYDAFLEMVKKGAKGMVLDLRNNPGGYLEVAVDLAGWFVPEGEIVVSEAGRNGERIEFKAKGSSPLLDFPTVVLMNEGSASASEILAGALRDIRGIKLVGTKSFGKGTVQQLLDLKDGSSVKLTVAHWVLPGGQVIDGEGLKPDHEVGISDEDIVEGRDPQLDKAKEILRGLL